MKCAGHLAMSLNGVVKMPKRYTLNDHGCELAQLLFSWACHDPQSSKLPEKEAKAIQAEVEAWPKLAPLANRAAPTRGSGKACGHRCPV